MSQASPAANPTEATAPITSGITFDALKAQLTKHDGLLQNLSISIDRWLVPPKPKKPATFMESLMAKVCQSGVLYYDLSRVRINFWQVCINLKN